MEGTAKKAQGFTPVKARHAKNSSRAHRCRHWQNGGFNNGNNDVCHGCHRKQEPGSLMLRREGHLFCQTCDEVYVRAIATMPNGHRYIIKEATLHRV